MRLDVELSKQIRELLLSETQPVSPVRPGRLAISVQDVDQAADLDVLTVLSVTPDMTVALIEDVTDTLEELKSNVGL